jgi:tripartite-type tricarboxylate transporter receptor subunit TctC
MATIPNASLRPADRRARRLPAVVAALLGLAALAPLGASAADAWPSRPLRIVVPFGPGGTTDLLGRLVAEGLGQSLGQPVTVDNKAGAGGNLGAAEVARAQPDGYTLLMGTPGPLAINQFIYASMPFRTDKDFAAVSYLANVPNVILANPATGFRNVADLLAAARARPGKLDWGSPGVGSTGHLMVEMLKQLAKVDISHVPYKGAAQANTDLLAGHIQLSGDNAPTALGHIKSGKLVALGVTSERELASLPGVAPVQATVPGYVLVSWFVVVAPAGTPKPVVDRLSAAIDAYIRQPAVDERLRGLGAIPVGGPPEVLARHLESEQARYRDVISHANIKLQ